jgi:hypothetical protein
MNSRALLLTALLSMAALLLGVDAPDLGAHFRPEGAMLLWAMAGVALILAAIRPLGASRQGTESTHPDR